MKKVSWLLSMALLILVSIFSGKAQAEEACKLFWRSKTNLSMEFFAFSCPSTGLVQSSRKYVSPYKFWGRRGLLVAYALEYLYEMKLNPAILQDCYGTLELEGTCLIHRKDLPPGKEFLPGHSSIPKPEVGTDLDFTMERALDDLKDIASWQLSEAAALSLGMVSAVSLTVYQLLKMTPLKTLAIALPIGTPSSGIDLQSGVQFVSEYRLMEILNLIQLNDSAAIEDALQRDPQLAEDISRVRASLLRVKAGIQNHEV